MTYQNPNKVDMRIDRTPGQWQKLLDAVKINNNEFLTKKEQDYYVAEISKKLIRFTNLDVLSNIADGAADLDDVGN